jgi:hypothetical protein
MKNFGASLVAYAIQHTTSPYAQLSISLVYNLFRKLKHGFSIEFGLILRFYLQEETFLAKEKVLLAQTSKDINLWTYSLYKMNFSALQLKQDGRN